MHDSAFLIVTSKKRRNRRQKVENQPAIKAKQEDFNVSRAISYVKDRIEEISKSQLFKEVEKALIQQERPQQIICFGLGSLGSFISQFQLALGLRLQSLAAGCNSIYTDPCFSDSDVTVLTHFGVEIGSKNLEGKFSADASYVTLFYLPHCPKQLVNNLLWANFCHQRLTKVILLTNSFHTIVLRSPSRILASSASNIQKLDPFAVEIALPDFESGDIFNDLAVIHFENLPEPESDFWTDNPEPVYTEDIELIQNDETSALSFA